MARRAGQDGFFAFLLSSVFGRIIRSVVLCLQLLQMKPHTKLQCYKYLTNVGCFILLCPNGVMWYWGNLSTYTNSYVRATQGYENSASSRWILSAFIMNFSLGVIVSHCLAKRLNRSPTILIGIAVNAAALFLSSIIIRKAPIVLLVSMGICTGLGSGILYGQTLCYVVIWNKSYIGLITALTTSGLSAGAIVTGQLMTLYINPDNVSADLTDGPEVYFTDTDIIRRVPQVFLIFGGAFLCCHILAFCLIREKPPEDSQSDSTFYDNVNNETRPINTTTPKGYLNNNKGENQTRSLKTKTQNRCIKRDTNESDTRPFKIKMTNGYPHKDTCHHETQPSNVISVGHNGYLNNQKDGNGSSISVTKVQNGYFLNDTKESETRPLNGKTPNRHLHNETIILDLTPKQSSSPLKFLSSPSDSDSVEQEQQNMKQKQVSHQPEEATDCQQGVKESNINTTTDLNHSDTKECKDVTTIEMLKTSGFYSMWFCIVSTDFNYVVMTNFYKTYGQLWIHNDLFLAQVGTFTMTSAMLMRLGWGIMADKFGIKYTLLIFTSCNCIVTIFWYFAPIVSKWLYMLWTILFGCATVGMYVVFSLAVLRLYGKTYHAKNYGLLLTATITCNLVGPQVINFILDGYGWFPLLVTGGAINVVALVVVIFGLPKV